MTARRLLPILLLGLAGLAAAADSQRASTPGAAILLLKEAWEANDVDAVTTRYAEPGASFVRSDIAASRRLSQAIQSLGRAVRDRLGPAAETELVATERRLASPLASATVTLLTQRIKGNTAVAKVRIADRDGERYVRYSFVVQGGDWKVVLAQVDGTPLDAPALARMATATSAREKTALALEETARDVASGHLENREALRRRLERISEREQAALPDAAVKTRAGDDDEGGQD